MKIPKKFKVFDSEIKIIIDPDLISNNQCSGQYYDGSGIIKLQGINDTFTADAQEISFFHELVHCSLEAIGEAKLSQNENFVERLGRVFKQIINTMEFQNEKD